MERPYRSKVDNHSTAYRGVDPRLQRPKHWVGDVIPLGQQPAQHRLSGGAPMPHVWVSRTDGATGQSLENRSNPCLDRLVALLPCYRDVGEDHLLRCDHPPLGSSR